MNKSPLPKKKKSKLTFADALKMLVDGKKITKKEWDDTRYYGFLEHEQLMLQRPDGKKHYWIVTLGDIVGEDWITI